MTDTPRLLDRLTALEDRLDAIEALLHTLVRLLEAQRRTDHYGVGRGGSAAPAREEETP